MSEEATYQLPETRPLSPEEIAVENDPYNDFSEEFFIELASLETSNKRFADETVLGTQGALDFVGKYSRFMPDRYVKAYELYKEAEKMSSEEAVSHLYALVEKVNKDDFSVNEKEKIALIKMMREPWEFVKEITAFYTLSVKKGKDVLSQMGIDFRISPVTLFFTLKKFADKEGKENLSSLTISPREYQALIFTTNHDWYGKKRVASMLMAANLRPFRQDKYYNKTLLKVPEELYKHLVQAVDNDTLFWRKRFIDYETDYDSPYPFELMVMSLSDKLKGENFNLAFEKLGKKKWKNATPLIEKVKENLFKKEKVNENSSPRLV